MTRRVSWSLLLGCALIASLDASTAWSILTRTLRANHSFVGELELVGDLVPRKPEPASIPDRSLPRRPLSTPVSETFQPAVSSVGEAPRTAQRGSARRASAPPELVAVDEPATEVGVPGLSSEQIATR